MESELLKTRRERLEKIDALVYLIGSTGRRFFYDPRKKTYGQMIMGSNGRLFWQDANTGKLIYLHYKYWKRGFSEGGTLKDLVDRLKVYAMTGDQLPPKIFGPWEKVIAGGDLWGYGPENMQKIREKAVELGIMSKSSPYRSLPLKA